MSEELNRDVSRGPLIATILWAGLVMLLSIPCALFALTGMLDSFNTWEVLYLIGALVLGAGGLATLTRGPDAKRMLLVGGGIHVIWGAWAFERLGTMALAMTAGGILAVIGAASGKPRFARDDDPGGWDEAHADVLTKFVSVGVLLQMPLCALAFLGGLVGGMSEGIDVFALSVVGLFSSVVSIVGAIFTLRRDKRAFRGLVVGGVSACFVPMVSLLFDDSGFVGPGLLMMFPAIAAGGLALSGALSIEMGKVQPLSIGRPVKTAGILFIAIIVGFSLFREDIIDIRNDVRREYWDGQCRENRDPDTCGFWALYTFRGQEDYAELRRARAELERLCDEGVTRACQTLAAAVRWRGQYWILNGTHKPKLNQRRVKLAEAACAQKKPAACAIRAMIKTADFHKNRLAEEYCAGGDELSCWLDTRLKTSQESADDDSALAEKLCHNGFTSLCTATSCKHDLGPSCAHDYSREAWNDALYGVRVDATGLETTCDAGDAEACFALGLNLTADADPFDEPVPTRSLELTMGKACQLGFDAACRVFALRLLDRPIGDERDEKRADELLQTACTAGDVRSCWMRARTTTPLVGEELTQLAEKTCRTSDAQVCMTYIRLRAAELELDPYAFDTQQALDFARRGCQENRWWSCHLYADTLLNASWLIPTYVRAVEAAKRACAVGEAAACDDYIMLAERVVSAGGPPPDELRKKVCPQVPNACEGWEGHEDE